MESHDPILRFLDYTSNKELLQPRPDLKWSPRSGLPGEGTPFPQHLGVQLPGEDAKVDKGFEAFLASQDVLWEILNNVDKISELKERYEMRCRAHNQYELVRLMEIIKSFEIDDVMYEALTFRETLIISKEVWGIEEPVPVGGICIDVQEADGEPPFEHLMQEYEAKLIQLLDNDGLVDDADRNLVAGAVGGMQPSDEMLRIENAIASEEELLYAPAEGYGLGKFLVHVSSQLNVDDANGGSNITSFVDRNLHTIEELRKEFITQDDFINEKSLYVALKHKWYFVKHRHPLQMVETRRLYSTRKAKYFISEGASFILERYLAITRFIGTFELAACYINGDLCRNIYNCRGPQGMVFHEKRIDICKIERTIIEECGIVHECLTTLTLEGRIIEQRWKNCQYFLHINPNTFLSGGKPKCNDDILLADSWKDDIELFSKYLDRKSLTLMENKTYLSDHPELKQLIADYTTSILMMRPSDILDFTKKHFGRFLDYCLPRNDYFD